MYRGFNLNEIVYKNEIRAHHWHEIERRLFDDNKQKIMVILKNYTLNEDVLDGSKMQSDWFPQLNSHIFISHSHKDEKAVITLAGRLYETFGLTAFIDSCIWGNANELLKLIDNKFCRNGGENTFNYTRRNHSTSHVHVMLATTLSKMIDKTESPWIYSEIAMSRLLRHKVPDRRRIEDTRMFSTEGSINEQLRIKYTVDLTHLVEIGSDALNLWQKCGAKGEKALDKLYELIPIKKSKMIQG